MSGNVHEATVIAKAPMAHGVMRWDFRVDPPEPLRFRPGQFVSMRVGTDAEGNHILRSYSIASSPGSPELSLILKLVPGGTASDWFTRLKLGDRVTFTGPMGFFVLDLQHFGDVVIGATGVGITPVLPMLREVLSRDEKGRVFLFWGNRHPDDLFWSDELAELEANHPRFKARLFISRPHPDWTGEHGRITQPILDALPTLERPTFYLVGNGAMIRELKAKLVEHGVDRKRQIRTEAFFD